MKQTDKIIWEWIVNEKPEAIGSEWSYYGSGFYSGNVESIKVSEIDWSKTRPLQSEQKSAFTDTFHEPETVDTLEGDLYLLDGMSFRVGLAINSQEMLNSIVDYMIERNK